MALNDNTRGEFVKWTGTIGIEAVNQLREALIELLASRAEPQLDLSGVEHCHIAVLQLFYSSQKSAARCAKQFTLTAPSAALLESAASLGFDLEAPQMDAQMIEGPK